MLERAWRLPFGFTGRVMARNLQLTNAMHSSRFSTRPTGRRWAGVLVAVIMAAHGVAQVMETDADRVIVGYNSFAFRLFKQLTDEQPGTNLCVSPFGVATVLSMVYHGATNRTLEELHAALDLRQLKPDAVMCGAQALLAAHRNTGQTVVLRTAQSAWFGGDLLGNIQLRPEYVNRNREVFAADTEPVDFSSPSTLDRINGWASRETDGLVHRILDKVPGPLPCDTGRLLLLNAVLFKGAWTWKFSMENNSHAQEFTLLDGTKKPCPRMAVTSRFMYLRDELCEVVRIPYGNGGCSMYVLLPRDDAFLAKLTYQAWLKRLGQFHLHEGTVRLPPFRFTQQHELTHALTSLGLRTLFDPCRAELPQISTAVINWVDSVDQRVQIEVDEKGTTAAAVTSLSILMDMRGGGPPPLPRFDFVADRPFVFLLRNDNSGLILFMGVVTDPT